MSVLGPSLCNLKRLLTFSRWLSCLMGRPPTILDDAIRLELPEDTPYAYQGHKFDLFLLTC